jgi:hypothetical protein
MAKTTDEIGARVQELTVTVSQLGPMLVGTLLEKHNRKRRRDGSEYLSAPYYTFQYRDQNGRRCWRRIPREQKGRVRKLVATGERYRALEREYTGCMTELGLQAASKKNA